MRFLLGVDDTDSLESRGTGFHVRQLAAALAEARLADPLGITRHQLLVDARIPYTSHNSSASVEIDADPARRDEIGMFCRDFLVRESAAGADVGLCLAARPEVTPHVLRFGTAAKLEVLTQAGAMSVAEAAGIQLWGLTGTRGGVIGALAAVGLRTAGSDGRFLWLPGLRELTGIHAVNDLARLAGIQAVQTISGAPVGGAERVDVGDWPRPVLHGGQAVLLVEEGDPDANNWRAVDRARVKERSS
jgi:hypothetical protein